MAQKTLKEKKTKVAPKQDAGEETSIVLVGTYGAAQMKKWILPKGYYNYPVGKDDDCTPAHCKRIKELWLYKGKSARKVFSAEFIGVKTRAELPDYPATKTKPHGEKYLLPPLENPKFTFVDLFAGIGGFHLAMHELGSRCLFASEWDKDAQRTCAENNMNTWRVCA